MSVFTGPTSGTGVVAGPLALARGMWQFVEGERAWNNGQHQEGVLDMVGGGLTTAGGGGALLGALGSTVGAWAGPAALAGAAGFALGRELDGALGLSDAVSDSMSESGDWWHDAAHPGRPLPPNAGSIRDDKPAWARGGRVPEGAW